MSWLKLNVSITSEGVITRNSGDPISTILVGQALQVADNFYEVTTVSSVDFTVEGWSDGDTTTSAKILPTVGDVVAAAQSLREVSVFGNNLLAQLAGLATGTGTKVITSADGVEHDIKTFPQLALDTADSFNEFGLGLLGNTITMLPTDSIDDLSMPTGFFRVINSHTGLRPDGFSIYGVLSVTRYDSSLLNQQYTDVNNKIASRVVKSDGVGDWSIEFNSGNSVNPLDFGIGKTDTTTDLGNFDDGYLGRGTGLSRSSGSSQGAPEGLSERNAVVLYMRRATSPNDESIEGAVLRIGTGSNSSDSPDVHIKSGRGTSTSEWIEMFHSGNSINPLDFGLGTTAKHIQDFDAAGDNPRGSEFMAAQPSTQNQPTGSGTNNWAGFRAKRFDTSYFEFWAAMSENRYFARSYNGGYKDWAEFFTSENSVNPLDFGLKDAVALESTDNLNDVVKSGFYYNVTAGNTSGNNYPISSAGSLTVISRGHNSSIQTQIFNPFNGEVNTTYTRTYGIDQWSNWNLTFDSGNSVNPLDFGIGLKANESGVLVDNNNFNDASKGLSRSQNSGTANTPNGGGFWTVLTMGYSGGTGAQLALGIDGKEAFIRGNADSSGYREWNELFHSANSVNPREFGLGGYLTNTKSDLKSKNLDTLTGGGLFSGFDGNNSNASTGDNPFPAHGGGFSLLSIKGVNDVAGEYTTQLVTRYSGAPHALEIKARSSGASGFGEWVNMFHSGNTNLDVFGSDGGAKILAQGVFVNPYKATFLLPLSSNGVPFSITLGLGGFQVTKNGFDNVEDNIPPSRVVLGPRSSYKLAEIEIEGFSGHTSGDPVFLRTVDASTKITVNF